MNLTPHKRLMCAALLAASMATNATPLQFSASGLFDANAPASFMTAPGASWSMSFTLDSDPVPVGAYTASGLFSVVPFTDFSYQLDGVPVVQPALWVVLYNVGNGGGVDVIFTDVLDSPGTPWYGLSLFGPQVYSGDEFTPTVQPGTYSTFHPVSDGFKLVVNDVLVDQGEARFTITAMPVPASLPLVLAGLGLLAGSRRRAVPA